MKFLEFFIYSNILVSLSAGSLAFACASKLGNPHYIGIGAVVFCATLFVYNFQRILRINEIRINISERHLWLEKHVFLIKVLSVVGLFSSVLIYFLVLGWNIDFWLLSVGAILGVLYALEVSSKSIALRDVPYIKIYLIAFQWTLVSVLWPYIRIAESVDFPFALMFSVIFFILAATVPFDIRDLVYDSKTKSTIPQLLGINGAKSVALLFLIVSAICLNISFPETFYCGWFYVSYFGLGILIIKSKINRHEMFFSGFIDAWIISFSLLLLIL